MVVLNIILNLILIPRNINSIGLKLFGLGATGAAIATVLSYLAGFIYIRIIAWKKTGIIGCKSVLIHLFASLISGLILIYINNFFEIVRWYHLLIVASFGLVMYLCILYFFREFKKEDLNFFIDNLNIKKMGNYILKELKNNK
jgi:Na+-driven multidrug efflux pump